MKNSYSLKSMAEKPPDEIFQSEIKDDATVIDVLATVLELNLIRPGNLNFLADGIHLFDTSMSVLQEFLELNSLPGSTTFHMLKLLVKLHPWKGLPRLFACQYEKGTVGAVITGFRRLFLQNCFIRYFPPKIQCLKELTCLHLSCNGIHLLTVVISSSNLPISFKVASGELIKTPLILFFPQKMESLNLSHNRFKLLSSPNLQLVLMGYPAGPLPAADDASNFTSCFFPVNEHGCAYVKKPVLVEGDCLSDLPDEILIMILSLLPLKEAAKTSILSRRWIFLWRHTTCLNFNNFKTVSLVHRGELELSPDVERDSFFEMVHTVLQSHRGSVIEVFKVCFGLVPESCTEIDGWIEFALRKRVKRLELDFTDFSSSKFNVGSYNLPILVFRNNCLDYLNSLSLTEVCVTGDFLEYILTSCRSLEILRVVRSLSLVTLKVPGPLLNLRTLSIMYCSNMESMDVSGINISSLTYRGGEIRFSVKDVPSIVKVDVGGPYSLFFMRNIYYFCRHLSGLETLVLDMTMKVYGDYDSFPIFPNLKELVLYARFTFGSCSLLPHTSIFPSCPVLQRFELKMLGVPPSDNLPRRWWWQTKEEIVQKGYGHENLKVVKMEGFAGWKVELEFVRFILKNVPSLKKLVMDTQSEFLLENPGATDEQSQAKARALARGLERSLPEGVELVIL